MLGLAFFLGPACTLAQTFDHTRSNHTLSHVLADEQFVFAGESGRVFAVTRSYSESFSLFYGTSSLAVTVRSNGEEFTASPSKAYTSNIAQVDIAASTGGQSSTVAMHVQFHDGRSGMVDVVLHADLMVGDDDGTPCIALENGTGLAALGSRFELQFLCRTGDVDSTDADHFWFGDALDLTASKWQQSQPTTYSGPDSAAAVYWLQRPLSSSSLRIQTVLALFPRNGPPSRPSKTPHPTQSPTSSRRPDSAMTMFTDERPNGFLIGADVSATGQHFFEPDSKGFQIGVRVSGVSSAFGARSETVNDVLITRKCIPFESIAVIIFRLTNLNSASRTVSLALFGDLSRRIENLTVTQSNTGFFSDSDPPISFACKNYPLADDADAFWFGSVGDGENQRFGQVEKTSHTETDWTNVGISISWKDRVLDPGETITLRTAVSFGTIASAPDLELTVIPPATLELDDNFVIAGDVPDSAVNGWTLLALVDSDRFLEISRSSGAGLLISTITASLGLSGGMHHFELYLLARNGAVSKGATFSCQFVSPEGRMAVESVTGLQGSVFDLVGWFTSQSYPHMVLTEGGFTMFISTSSNLKLAIDSLGIWKREGIPYRIDTKVTTLGPLAIVAIKIESALDDTIDVSIQAALAIDGVESSSCAKSPSSGFYSEGNSHSLAFLCTDHPMVVDASAYWFGSTLGRFDQNFSQVEVDSFSGEPSAMSVSWHSVDVKSHQPTVLSTVIRIGSGSTHPTLTIQQLEIPAGLPQQGSFRVTGVYTDSDDDSGTIVLVIDFDYTNIVPIEIDLVSGLTFDREISIGSLNLANGSHDVQFYAIDSTGMVSSCYSSSLYIGNPPSQSPPETQTPTETQSPVSQSPIESQSPVSQSPTESESLPRSDTPASTADATDPFTRPLLRPRSHPIFRILYYSFVFPGFL
jgi:hypothetical protein